MKTVPFFIGKRIKIILVYLVEIIYNIKDMERSRAKKGVIISILGGVANLVLSSLKITIGLIAGSLSVLYDGFNNLTDFFSNAGAAAGFGVTSIKKNKKYPNGYGRIEYIISFLISVVVLIVGIFFILGAIERLIIPQPIGFSWIYFYILLGTALIKVLMALIYRHFNKKLLSPMLSALEIDSFQDAGITALVVLSFVLSQYIGFPIDAVCGLVMAVIIIINCSKLIAKSFRALMGGGNMDLKQKIEEYVLSYEGVDAVKNIYIYDYGYDNVCGSIEIIMDGKKDLESVIQTTKNIKEEIKKNYNIKINIDMDL